MFLIKNPIITEKATDLSKMNKYVFKVQKNASSDEIKKAVNDVYGVNVTKVNIINRKSKSGYYRGVPDSLKTRAYKKAIVTIKEGQSIDIIAH